MFRTFSSLLRSSLRWLGLLPEATPTPRSPPPPAKDPPRRERFSPLAPRAVVVRLLDDRKRKTFFPNDSDYPGHSAFLPSPDDQQQAIERKRSPALSVNDNELTTIAEGEALRDLPRGSGRPLFLRVEAVLAKSKNKIHFEVYADPPEDPERAKRPGALGHSAIEGVEREGMLKNERRDAREALIDCAKLKLEDV